MDSVTIYECHNTACTLGVRSEPGRFSEGATAQQITLLTGNPEPENFGPGVCPNCGEVGVEAGTDSAPHEGHDPYQPLHDEVQRIVEDPDNKATGDDAMLILMDLVERSEA